MNIETSGSWSDAERTNRRVGETAVEQVGRRRKYVKPGWLLVDDVTDGNAPRDQHIGNDPAMAAPPDRLGAHAGRPGGIRNREELGESLLELAGCHVIGIGPEGRVPPSGVG